MLQAALQPDFQCEVADCFGDADTRSLVSRWHDIAAADSDWPRLDIDRLSTLVMDANYDRLVLGARHATFHRPELGGYAAEKLLSMTGATLELVTGVLTDECEALRPEMQRR